MMDESIQIQGETMSRTAGLLLIMLLLPLYLAAQDAPKVEVFGGYAMAGIDDQTLTGKRILNHGWNGAVAFNVNSTLGLVADFGGYYGTHNQPSFTIFNCPGCPITIPGFPVPTRMHTFMFGPQVSARMKSITPFGHLLIGMANMRTDPNPAPPPGGPIPVDPGLPTSDTGLAFAVGGGVDTRLTQRIAWKCRGTICGPMCSTSGRIISGLPRELSSGSGTETGVKKPASFSGSAVLKLSAAWQRCHRYVSAMPPARPRARSHLNHDVDIQGESE